MKRNRIGKSALIVLFLGSGVDAANAQAITYFSIPTAQSGPSGIVAGPDGNLWFTEFSANKIGRITTAGVVTEFAIPQGLEPRGIASGRDGALWFTAQAKAAPNIGRITTAGVITEFPVSSAAGESLGEIAPGADGNLWFTEGGLAPDKIGRITTAGVVTEFPIVPSVPGHSAYPVHITAGPDGSLWFTESKGDKIGRITTAGTITEFPLSHGDLGNIAPGPDGALWFTGPEIVGRITTAGVVTEFPVPSQTTGLIVAGSDGNLWFTEAFGSVGRISTDGAITQFTTPTTGDEGGITAGPDGAIWFTDTELNRIGRMTTSGIEAGTCLPDQYSLCLSGGRFRATATYSNPLGSGTAAAHGLSDSSGVFTFDNPDSVELVVKVLNACSFTPNIWVFAAGLTNQEVTLTVTDMKTGFEQTYSNPPGTTFVTVTDTAAFSTCP